MTELGLAALALQLAMVAVQGLISWRKGRNGHDHGAAAAAKLAAQLSTLTAHVSTLAGKLSHLESESVRISARVEEVSKRVHDQGGLVGAAAMVPEMMRKLSAIAEKVAHIEGMLIRRRDADME